MSHTLVIGILGGAGIFCHECRVTPDLAVGGSTFYLSSFPLSVVCRLIIIIINSLFQEQAGPI